MTVGTAKTCTCNAKIGPFPANGVIYVENETCNGAYSPFNRPTRRPPGCGNVYVKGEYSAPLTIAAENDIIITGNLDRRPTKACWA